MTALLDAPIVRADIELMTDDELFYGYSQGQLDKDSAFTELVSRWQETAEGQLTTSGVHDSDRDDVLQIAYQQAHQFRDSFQPGIGAKTWFMQIVKNAARDFLKTARRQRRTPKSGKPISIEHKIRGNDGHDGCVGDLIVDPTAREPIDVLIEAEDNAALHEATNKLPPHLREVIELRFYEDLSQDEIRERLGITRGTVKSRLGRGLHKLRELMEIDCEDQE